MTYHIPNLGGCWWESRPHWCNEDPGHDGDLFSDFGGGAA